MMLGKSEKMNVEIATTTTLINPVEGDKNNELQQKNRILLIPKVLMDEGIQRFTDVVRGSCFCKTTGDANEGRARMRRYEVY